MCSRSANDLCADGKPIVLKAELAIPGK